jgi:riboflavin synthase
MEYVRSCYKSGEHMFTGIVQKLGLIVRSWMEGSKKVCWIKSEFHDLDIGESIAVDGICLTVTAINGDEFCCELSIETLQKTIAQNYAVNQIVNLERALRLSDRVSGHFVLGHIDQVMQCCETQSYDGCLSVTFTGVLPANKKYLLPKGSITINGVSLTINAIQPNSFTVMLIPHTLAMTTLQNLQVDTLVNVEFDYLCRIVLNKIEDTQFV